MLFAPMFFASGIFIFLPYFKNLESDLGITDGQCLGVCSLQPTYYEEPRDNNYFNSCEPKDPMTVFFLRVPKCASTRFMTLTEIVRTRKGFMIEEFPDFPEAVAAASDEEKWDPNRIVISEAEKRKFYNGVMTKIGLQSLGRSSRSGMPWSPSPPPPNERGVVSRHDSSDRVLRMFGYGHMFLPPWSSSRHFQGDYYINKVPAVISLVRDPIARMGSAYNYVRAGARSQRHREIILENRGNLTLAQCTQDDKCMLVNQLRKTCSLQALYFCGDHEDCKVHWHLLNEDNHVVKVDKMLKRALRNMETEVLLTGVADGEWMDRSMKILETVLPTYFEGMAWESEELDREKAREKEEEREAFDRDFKSGKKKLATNEAPSYAKPNKEERRRIVDLNICHADFAIVERAKQLIEEKERSCNA